MKKHRKTRKWNRWVTYVHDLWLLDTLTWERRVEAASNGWATEAAEFEASHPRPRFKDYLVGLSQKWSNAA